MSRIAIYIDTQSTRNQYRLRLKKSNSEVIAMYTKDEDEAKRFKRFLKKVLKAIAMNSHEPNIE